MLFFDDIDLSKQSVYLLYYQNLFFNLILCFLQHLDHLDLDQIHV